jgi:hypothetical protein
LVVVRYPNEVSTAAVNEAIAGALAMIPHEEIVGALLIVEPARVRMLRRVGHVE